MAWSRTRAPFVSLAAATAVLGACGDNLAEDPRSLVERLEALPGVTVTPGVTGVPGYTYVTLRFTQPVDQLAPDGQTFEQVVSLIHRDPHAPMIVQTSGYWDYYLDYPVELTRLLGANQISIEHRYFGSSRPEPADWSKLDIEQMAHDQHAIIEALRSIYDGAFVTTGGSKGGMTAIYHRRFFPDDVDATVPYVAPASFGAPDLRYAPFLDTLGPAACRQAVRDVAIELLANRRAMVLERATTQAADEALVYTRVPLGPAVESAIVGLEWSFWQYYGVSWCGVVPVPSASDEDLWKFLDDVSPPSDNNDDRIAQFEAYYHQAYAQLGYPDGGAAYLEPYVMYDDAAYDGALPAGKPTYDGGAAMRDIDAWVQGQGDRLLFIYGEWDPWTAGKFALGSATDSTSLTEPEGSHGARLLRLADADRAVAFEQLARWTGVTPEVPQSVAAAGPSGAEAAERSLDIRRATPPPAMRRRPR